MKSELLWCATFVATVHEHREGERTNLISVTLEWFDWKPIQSKTEISRAHRQPVSQDTEGYKKNKEEGLTNHINWALWKDKVFLYNN